MESESVFTLGTILGFAQDDCMLNSRGQACMSEGAVRFEASLLGVSGRFNPGLVLGPVMGGEGPSLQEEVILRLRGAEDHHEAARPCKCR